MSAFLKIFGAIFSMFIAFAGLELSESVGILLIFLAVFQYCLLWCIISMYDMIKELKGNNIPYIEDLVVYTKNQVKEIKAKVDNKQSGNMSR